MVSSSGEFPRWKFAHLKCASDTYGAGRGRDVRPISTGWGTRHGLKWLKGCTVAVAPPPLPPPPVLIGHVSSLLPY
jgi:hypothetical protein